MTEAEKERAAVVAWLRREEEKEHRAAISHRRPRGGFSTYETMHYQRRSALLDAIEAVEAGDHLKGTDDE